MISKESNKAVFYICSLPLKYWSIIVKHLWVTEWLMENKSKEKKNWWNSSVAVTISWGGCGMCGFYDYRLEHLKFYKLFKNILICSFFLLLLRLLQFWYSPILSSTRQLNQDFLFPQMYLSFYNKFLRINEGFFF